MSDNTAACVTANVPLIEVLSNEVVPATVKLSDNVAACVTANVPLIEVLSNEVVPATVKLSDNVAAPVRFKSFMFAVSLIVILS